MEDLDFETVINFNPKDFLDYMVKHKVWIRKNNYKLAWKRLSKFSKFVEEAKSSIKNLTIFFIYVVMKKPKSIKNQLTKLPY
jgi:HD superfamily phosphohydrolase